MLTVITGTADGVVIQHVDGDATVGRWCRPPALPDRCYFCISGFPVVGYVVRGLWRCGVCASCRPAAERGRLRYVHLGGGE